tara:strand:+ start:182 stop:427 length:246 start_codon:yes stop_codon:yes gene_type:complete
MEIVMIKKKGCMPCKNFEPIVHEIANNQNISFRTIMAEKMPEKIRPEFYPYFFLYDEGKVIENWGGTSDRKVKSVLKRHVK